MRQVAAQPGGIGVKNIGTGTAVLAWVAAAIFFFFQYVLRSAPSVMSTQLSDAFGLSAPGLASMIGLFYYGLAPFSLVTGAALDRWGPQRTLPIGAGVVALGAILFAVGGGQTAALGRLLQGVGGAIAPVGAIYIATRFFPASKTATLVGATQMFGMAGGAVGQFAVGSLIAGGLNWKTFWIGSGLVALAIAVLLPMLLPKQGPTVSEAGLRSTVQPFYVVFKNPQSILCGLIAGLLFIPTTIFDMVWGVRYLQEAHGFDYAAAVLRSATVPFGWIIGCPLLGFISDRLGRRKPVIIGGALALMLCLALILFAPKGTFPPYMLGLLTGVASGAAMLPYIVIKEVNPPQFAGTSTGVLNFLNYSFSALLGPIFGWLLKLVSSGATPMELEHYQIGFAPLLLGVGVSIILAFLLKETGCAAQESFAEAS